MRTRFLVLPILVVLALAACTTAASPSVSSPAATPTATAGESPSPDESSPATGAVTVQIADSDLGQILVDGDGMTLYAFTPDEAGTPTCYDACAEAWPPLLSTDEVTVGAGLDDSDFSTVTRTDGGDQVKVASWPLYHFSGDAAAGDTNGQGLNGKWHVVSPSGERIK